MLTPVKSKQEQKMDLHQKMVTMFQSSLLKIMTNYITNSCCMCLIIVDKFPFYHFDTYK